MKSVIFFFILILSLYEGFDLDDIRNVELVCDKEDGCLKECVLTYQPKNMRDEAHLKYQKKYNDCLQAASGESCERHAQIKDCFIEGEPEVFDTVEDNWESYAIYWLHMPNDLNK
uniref:Salivary OBP/D7 family protein n=1 Tax=Simulium nigrimanum TaxID=683695 RepID=D1FQ22_SIMNI